MSLHSLLRNCDTNSPLVVGVFTFFFFTPSTTIAASTVTNVTGEISAFASAGSISEEQMHSRPPLDAWLDVVNASATDIACFDPPACLATASASAHAHSDQESSVSPSGDFIFARTTADASAFPDEIFGATAIAISQFEVSFSLDSPYNYVLGGVIEGRDSSMSFGGERINGLPLTTVSFTRGGVLPPGTYSLTVFGASIDDGASNFSGPSRIEVFFELTAVVPIPASIWLFGSGLLGLVGIARRKAAKP